MTARKSTSARFRSPPGTISGHLLLLHDLSYIDERVSEARFYSILALVGVAVGSWLARDRDRARPCMRAWTRSIRSAIVERAARRRSSSGAASAAISPTSKEIHALLAELRAERRIRRRHPRRMVAEDAAARCSIEELPGAEVLVVSNREPYIHNRANGDVALQIPASGLVAALEPVMRACGGTWIAHGSGSADRETVDAHDRIRVPPDDPAYTLRRVWLTEEEQDGYYYGFANEGLWPLCHIAFVRPTFREQDWAQYQAVNERFADVVAQEANQRRSDRPGAGLSLRAAAAHDPRAAAEGDHHHLLAHPLAERRDLRHLPVARGDHRRPARQHDPRLPHAVPLQQLPRGRRSLHGEPDRSRARLGHLRRPRDPDPALSDLDRMAAGGAGDAGAGAGMPRRRARSASACPPTRASPSASSGSTTPRAFSTACARSTTC